MSGFLLPSGEGQDEGKKDWPSLLDPLTLALSRRERELLCSLRLKLGPVGCRHTLFVSPPQIFFSFPAGVTANVTLVPRTLTPFSTESAQ